LPNTGFRVQGSGFRVQGSGFRVQGSGFRVQGSEFRVQGSYREEDDSREVSEEVLVVQREACFGVEGLQKHLAS